MPQPHESADPHPDDPPPPDAAWEAMVRDEPAIAEFANETERPYYCVQCGYQLTGIASDACPECGAEIDYEDDNCVTLDPPGFVDSDTYKQIESTGAWFFKCIVIGLVLIIVAAFFAALFHACGTFDRFTA